MAPPNKKKNKNNGNDDDDDSSSSSSSSSNSTSSSKDQNEERPTKKQKSSSNPIADNPMELIAATTSTSSSSNKRKSPPIIILLDQASAETVKNRRGIYELLNCDDHRDLCKKKLHKDPNLYRPDILHQELLAILDSPLNKSGNLKVYIKTTKNVLIEVHPSIRIPRTYKRFAGLMVQLLHKMKIKSGTDSTTLLKVIKNPFSQHLPAGTRCYGMSCEGTLFSPIALAKAVVPPDLLLEDHVNDPPICFVVGAMSTGHVTINDHPYIEKMISISEYPLSGASALSRLLGGIEHHWGIV